jgi:hypothetical protein
MFTGSNYKKHSKKINKVYSNDFFDEIFNSLKIKDNKKKKIFKKCIKKAGLNYLNAINNNSERIQPNKQKDILNNYADALIETQNKYREVQAHGTTSAKLHKTLRRISNTTEPAMKDMFHPYIGKNKEGLSTDLFDRFLGLLAESAQQAPNEDIGKDKKELSGNYMAYWVALIRKGWVECIEGIPFEHGKHYKEINDTTAKCPEILHEIFLQIVPNTPKQKIKTALRKVIKTDINEPVTNFFLK